MPCRIFYALLCSAILCGCAQDPAGRKPATSESDQSKPPVSLPTATPLPPQPALPTPSNVSLFQVRSKYVLQLQIRGRKLALRLPEEAVLRSSRRVKAASLSRSDWVFLGYGVSLPALGWDSYRDADVQGKTVLMLAGMPALPDGANVSSQTLLSHPVDVHLGDWQAKVSNARDHGASLVLLVEDTEADQGFYAEQAGFSEALVTAEEFTADNPVIAFGWVPVSRVKQWMRQAGVNWEGLKRKAGMLDFQAAALPIQSNLQVTNQWRPIEIKPPVR